MGDVSTGLLITGGVVCLLAGTYVACYTIWVRNWEGWGSWNRRTGLDEDRAIEERLARERQRPR
jgi:hypothetical protein